MENSELEKRVAVLERQFKELAEASRKLSEATLKGFEHLETTANLLVKLTDKVFNADV